MQRFFIMCALVPALAACGGDDDDGGVEPDLTIDARGSHPLGTRRIVAMDESRGRELTLQVWYPAGATSAAPIELLEEEPDRTTYGGLLDAAPGGCPTDLSNADPTATNAPRGGPFPLILFSHCHECTRLSGLSIAERLVSHGFVVVAVDHEGNTLWDRLDGASLPLDTETLELRVGDLEFARAQVWANAALADVAAVVDPDPAHEGVFGHSFGSVTAGLYAQRHGVGAVFGLAAPMENPLLAGVTITEISEPIGFLVAREDNSITELGNDLIRGNFMRAPGPAWKIEVADAGHWSVSDLNGLVEAFAPGCGDGERQTDGQPFTYLAPAVGRGIAASYVTAFFKANLLADAGARAYLETPRPAATVTVETRAP